MKSLLIDQPVRYSETPVLPKSRKSDDIFEKLKLYVDEKFELISKEIQNIKKEITQLTSTDAKSETVLPILEDEKLKLISERADLLNLFGINQEEPERKIEVFEDEEPDLDPLNSILRDMDETEPSASDHITIADDIMASTYRQLLFPTQYKSSATIEEITDLLEIKVTESPKPESPEPELKIEVVKLESPKSKPESPKPELKIEVVKPESPKPESPKSKPESPKPESPKSKPESPKPESPKSKPESPKSKPESPKPESPKSKPESPKLELKIEVVKPESPKSKPELKIEVVKPESPKSKPESPEVKVDATKSESPKSKPDSPKPDSDSESNKKKSVTKAPTKIVRRYNRR